MIDCGMTIGFEKDGLRLELADSEEDVRAARVLRYDVFVRELGGTE
jgi:putative hemolysin